MYADPALSLWLTECLYRWLRKRRLPHGVPDPYYRGIRLTYSRAYQILLCIASAFMLAIAGALCCMPGTFEHRPLGTIAIIIFWVAVCISLPLHAFREFVVVSDKGLTRCPLFSTPINMSWEEITALTPNPGVNEIVFKGGDRKLKMSLCYNGWEDFREFAHKHLSEHLNSTLDSVLDDGKSPSQGSSRLVRAVSRR